MDNTKIQSLSKIAGVTILFIVIIAQLFKTQNFISEAYLPYLSLLSLVLLSISLYMKAKLGGFNQYNIPLKLILIFLTLTVGGIFLIYYFTT